MIPDPIPLKQIDQWKERAFDLRDELRCLEGYLTNGERELDVSAWIAIETARILIGCAGDYLVHAYRCEETARKESLDSETAPLPSPPDENTSPTGENNLCPNL